MESDSVGGEVRGTAVAPSAASGLSVDPPQSRSPQLGLVVDGAPVAPERRSASKGVEGVCGVCDREIVRCACEQYHTPPKLADRAVSLLAWSKRSEGVILDLGAGGGALTDAVLRALPSVLVVAVERDHRWVSYLRARYRGNARVRVVEADVDVLASMGEREACARLGLDEPADAIVSNPPFKGGGFVRFGLAAIQLARLGAPAVFVGPIVALPTVTSLGLWCAAEIADLAVCSRRPEFGNEVKRDTEDFIVVRFTGERGMGETHHGARIHFWPEAWS